MGKAAYTIITNDIKMFLQDIKVMPGINFECNHRLLL
jgi:hypothetical protein